MLRGNHESRAMTEHFTFRQEILNKFKDEELTLTWTHEQAHGKRISYNMILIFLDYATYNDSSSAYSSSDILCYYGCVICEWQKEVRRT